MCNRAAPFSILLAVILAGSLLACSADDSDSETTEVGGSMEQAATNIIEDDGFVEAEPEPPACSDGRDNDGDLLVDLDDPGCEDALDDNEEQPVCNDGIDNDMDGLIDFPDDPGCGYFDDSDEFDEGVPRQCADGIDNDRNGYVDEYDAGCASAFDNEEEPTPVLAQCSDRMDNDEDGLIDFPNDPGCPLAGDDDESDPVSIPVCANGVDDDADGLVDFPNDPGCAGVGDQDEADKPVTPDCSDGLDNDRDGRIDFPDDSGCTAASDYNERGSCLDQYDPPRLLPDTPLVLNTSAGTFSAAGTCGGNGSPELVVLFKLEEPVDALEFTTVGEGTSVPTSLYIRYNECLVPEAELLCGLEASDAANPGQTLTLQAPEPGDYFVFVDGVAGGGGQVSITVREVPLAQCRNGMDDDGDGLTDYPEEPGCTDLQDQDEADPEPLPACSDGADNDGDGLIDYPLDFGCVSASRNSEANLCGDGIRVREYPFGAEYVMGNTDNPAASSNALDSTLCSDVDPGQPEVVFLYRNPYSAQLRLDTAHPETTLNTAVYILDSCGIGADRVESACNSGNDIREGESTASYRGQLTSPTLPPGEYFVIVDRSFGVGGEFKLSIESIRDEPACDDLMDNDGDGQIDAYDPGCRNLTDRNERDPLQPPACNDGEDNDEDGLVDFPADPGCETAGDGSEEDSANTEDPTDLPPTCANGADDDEDGLIDYPDDPGCAGRGDPSEIDPRIAPQCNNGVDDDRDGFVDLDDPDCLAAGDPHEQVP